MGGYEMTVKINTLTEAEIRSIGDAFADFAYAEAECGMSYLAKDRQAVSDYICAYVRMAIKERVLYSTSEKHEAFIAFKRAGLTMSLSSAADLLGTAYRSADFTHILTACKGFLHSGKGYGAILSKFKIPYFYVGMVAVTKDYQGQGYMRKLLEIAFEEGRKHGMPVVLDIIIKNKITQNAFQVWADYALELRAKVQEGKLEFEEYRELIRKY